MSHYHTNSSPDKRYLQVADRYRTSELSQQPGGVEVMVHWANGLVLVYDKIKYPDSYIVAILNGQRFGLATDPEEVEKRIINITINDVDYYPNEEEDLPWVNFRSNPSSFYNNQHHYA